jgi:hypothetical protein
MCIALFQKKHRAAPDGWYPVFVLLPPVVPETDPGGTPIGRKRSVFPSNAIYRLASRRPFQVSGIVRGARVVGGHNPKNKMNRR